MSTTSRKATTTVAAALALLVVTNPAQADFTLGLQEDNGALIEVTASRDGGATYEGSVGINFHVFVGFDNLHLLGSDALVQQGILRITNTDRHEHVLHMRAARQNFTIPEGTDLSLLDSHTQVIGSVSVSFQTYGLTSNAPSDDRFTGLAFAFPVSGLSRSLGLEQSLSGVSPDGAPYLVSVSAHFPIGEIGPPTQGGR